MCILVNLFPSRVPWHRLLLDETGYYRGILNLIPRLKGLADRTATWAFVDDNGGEELVELDAGRKSRPRHG